MQTFLPHDSIWLSLSRLDDRRLGKQRVEALQIYRALTWDDYGWKNHPAVRMWEGCEHWVMVYHDAAIDAWEHRGFNNNMVRFDADPGAEDDMPWWWGDERLHSSHRAALLHKAPEHYGRFNWAEEPKLDYWWPV